MKLGNISIFVKLLGITIILCLLLALTGWFGLNGVSKESSEAAKLQNLSKYNSILLEREIDHLNWARGVTGFFLDHSQTSLTVQKSPTLCNLGKWFGDQAEMKALAEIDPELLRIIENGKKDHEALHRSAVTIEEIFKASGGNHTEAADQMLAAYNTQTKPALAKVRTTLRDLADLLNNHTIIEQKEIHEVATRTKRNIALITLFSVVVGGLISFIISRMLSSQIGETVTFANKLASGDFTANLAIEQQDEVGSLAKAMNNIVGNLSEMVTDIQNGSKSLSSSSDTLSSVASQLAAGADQTSGKASTVATAAEEMSTNMESVAAATEQAATNINMVAAATEEMTATITEISSNTAKTSDMASEASSKADQTSHRVDELGKSAQEISKVTETITEISEQTNLLALNATIEAARAGEAGKGFAVVANEIKELAKQTAQATLEIRNNIEGVQSATEHTVTEINEVSIIIKKLNEMSSGVASAVEEQSATTQEIAGNINQASEGIQEVTANIAQVATVTSEITSEVTDVNTASGEVQDSSEQVLVNAQNLRDLSQNLEEIVSKFKI